MAGRDEELCVDRERRSKRRCDRHIYGGPTSEIETDNDNDSVIANNNMEEDRDVNIHNVDIETVVEDYGGPISDEVIKSYKTHISSSIWRNEERSILQCINHGSRISQLHIPSTAVIFRETIENSGLFPLISTCYSSTNKILVSAFVERWHPETNTFHMPFGECTITLDDVYCLLHIPVQGTALTYKKQTTTEAVDRVKRLLGIAPRVAEQEMNSKVGQKLSFSLLKSRFEEVCDSWPPSKIRKAARAYLLFLLGNTLFADKSKTHVSVQYLWFLDDLEMVHTYAWGAAALAYMYRQLGISSRSNVRQISGYMSLLESWIYEHFVPFRPNMKMYSEDMPRAARWHPARELRGSLQIVRVTLDNLPPNEFVFDPYMHAREHHPFQNIAWYCGCLICLDVVEPYHPTRVLRQFGRVQNIPQALIRPQNTSRGGDSHVKSHVLNMFIDATWSEWRNHILVEINRSTPLDNSPVECSSDYMEWYTNRTVRKVQNPRYLKQDIVMAPIQDQPTCDDLYECIESAHEILKRTQSLGVNHYINMGIDGYQSLMNAIEECAQITQTQARRKHH